MGYTMATAVCDNCGARRHLSQHHRSYEPGTTVNLWCDCSEDEYHPYTNHTIAAKDAKLPKRPMARVKCDDCGHERRLGQQRRIYEIGVKISIECRNRNSKHRWHYKQHTVIDNGGVA